MAGRRQITGRGQPAALACAAMLASLAAGPPPVPAPARQCSVDVYAVDQDRTSNVRAAPSSDSAIEARIDPSYAVLHIVSVSGSWFQVSRIDDAETDMRLFEGKGWVHRSLLGLSVAGGDHWLMSAPDSASTRLQHLTPDGNRLDPVDCKGDWLKVVVDGSATGWIDRATQCSNPMTTCS